MKCSGRHECTGHNLQYPRGKASMEERRKGNRIVYIDVLKGVAAFMVVLGHIVTYDAAFEGLYNFIYSFHMPLFTFLSGCTTELSYRNKTGTNAVYLKKRFLNIMVPYFAWAFLLPVVAAGAFTEVNWYSVMMRTFVTNRMFWFLPTLYGLIAVYICYRRLGDGLRSRSECCRQNKKTEFLWDSISCMVVVGVTVILMVLTGYQLLRDIVGFTIPFFAAVMYMEHEWIYELFQKRVSVAAALVIFILLIGRFDFDRISVVTSLLRMLLGMCAVVVLLHIFTKLRIPRLLIRLLSFWGRYSLLIYILHIQIMQSSGLLKVDFSSKWVTLSWYCAVSCLVCFIGSGLAMGMEHIPIIRTVLLGKKGDGYVKN